MKIYKYSFIVVLFCFGIEAWGQIPGADLLEEHLKKSDCPALYQLTQSYVDHAETTITYGKCLIRDEKFEDAIDHFKSKKDDFDDHADFHFWFGQAYLGKLNTIKNFFEKGVWSSKTKKEFEKAVDLDPDHVDARHSLANYYLNAPAIAGGSKKKARQQIDEIKKRDPKRGYGIQARLYSQEKKYEEARKEYMNYLAISGDSVGVYYLLGFDYQTQELFPEAFEAFQTSIDAGDKQNNSYYQYGRTAVFSNSHKEEALEYLKHYVEYPTEDGPAITFAYWRMGMIYQLMEEHDTAKEHFEKALSLDPNNKQASESLKEMN